MADEPNATSSTSEIPRDLVRQVADKVYKMLLQDAQIDYERRRMRRSNRRFNGGR